MHSVENILVKAVDGQRLTLVEGNPRVCWRGLWSIQSKSFPKPTIFLMPEISALVGSKSPAVQGRSRPIILRCAYPPPPHHCADRRNCLALGYPHLAMQRHVPALEGPDGMAAKKK